MRNEGSTSLEGRERQKSKEIRSEDTAPRPTVLEKIKGNKKNLRMKGEKIDIEGRKSK